MLFGKNENFVTCALKFGSCTDNVLKAVLLEKEINRPSYLTGSNFSEYIYYLSCRVMTVRVSLVQDYPYLIWRSRKPNNKGSDFLQREENSWLAKTVLRGTFDMNCSDEEGGS